MKRSIVVVSILAVTLMAAGCYMKDSDLHKGQPLEPNYKRLKAYQVKPRPGSLYTPVSSRLYSDFRARKVGDIVVVQVVENSSASKKAETTASRQSSLSAGITHALGFTNLIPKGKNFWKETQVGGTPNLSTLVKGSMTNSHTGTGETKKEDSITTSVAARVMAVLPNGLLYIKGSRMVKVNFETQIVRVSGLVNPSDISAANTVQQTQIADCRVTYSGKGPLTDKQRPGWLTRILDLIWPF